MTENNHITANCVNSSHINLIEDKEKYRIISQTTTCKLLLILRCLLLRVYSYYDVLLVGFYSVTLY